MHLKSSFLVKCVQLKCCHQGAERLVNMLQWWAGGSGKQTGKVVESVLTDITGVYVDFLYQ